MCSEHSLGPCPHGDVDLPLCSLVIWILKKAKWFQCPEKGFGTSLSQLRSRSTLSPLSFSHIWLLKGHSQHPWQTMPTYKRAQRGRGQVCCLALQPAKSTTLCISGSFTHPVSNSGSLQARVFIDTIYIVLNFHHSLLCTFFRILKNWHQCLTHTWSQDWVIVL